MQTEPRIFDALLSRVSLFSTRRLPQLQRNSQCPPDTLLSSFSHGATQGRLQNLVKDGGDPCG